MKKRILFWLAAILLASLWVGMTAHASLLLAVINRSFLAGLLLLLFGCLSAVIRSGFFRLFLHGFREIKQLFFRKPRILQSDLYQLDDPAFTQKKETFIRCGTSFLIEAGLACSLFSVCLTCFYYSH